MYVRMTWLAGLALVRRAGRLIAASRRGVTLCAPRLRRNTTGRDMSGRPSTLRCRSPGTRQCARTALTTRLVALTCTAGLTGLIGRCFVVYVLRMYFVGWVRKCVTAALAPYVRASGQWSAGGTAATTVIRYVRGRHESE